MKPESVLRVKKHSNGQIVINGDGCNTITVHGSSVPVNVMRGVSSNFIVIEPDKEGIIAVEVECSSHKDEKSRHNPINYFLLNVEKDKDEKFSVNMGFHGKTCSGRLPQLNGRGFAIKVKDELFLSERPLDAYIDQYPPFSVVDGDTICKYAAGDITEEEFLQSAQKIKEEVCAREELPKVKKELEELNEKLSKANKGHFDTLKEFARCATDLEKLKNHIDGLFFPHKSIKKMVNDMYKKYCIGEKENAE